MSLSASKPERLTEFFQRLAAAPAATTAAEALALVRRTLDAVEDELTSIPNNPASWQTDGRMYPPQDDAARPDRAGVTRYRNRRHNTLIGDNGAIEIHDEGGIAFEKAGANNRKVSDP